MIDPPMCDFCWGPKWGRIFRTDLGIQPEWHACSECASMIETENWNGLLLRAVGKHSEKYPDLPRRIVADGTKRTHELFRAHYRKAP